MKDDDKNAEVHVLDLEFDLNDFEGIVLGNNGVSPLKAHAAKQLLETMGWDCAMELTQTCADNQGRYDALQKRMSEALNAARIPAALPVVGLASYLAQYCTTNPSGEPPPDALATGVRYATVCALISSYIKHYYAENRQTAADVGATVQ